MSTAAQSSISDDARNYTWLLQRFCDSTPGVNHAVTVSTDGLLVTMAGGSDRSGGERLAAIVSGIASLAAGAGPSYGLGAVNKVVIDTEEGYLLVMALSAGALLGVVADRSASLATVAYEMALLVNRSGATLSPQLIHELKNPST